MSTTPIMRGTMARGAFADQSDFKTAATTGFKGFWFYKSTLREQVPIETDPVIGGAFQNGRDEHQHMSGLSNHGGTLLVPVCLNGFGDWLKLFLGAATTSGTTNKTHVFSSGTATLPSRTIEMQGVTSDFRSHIGVVSKELKFGLKDDKGNQQCELALVGRTEALLTSSGAGSYTTPTYDPVKAVMAEVLLGGSAISLCSDFNMVYTTGAMLDRYIDGSGLASAAVFADDATCTGSFKVRYTGQTLDAAAVAETDQAMTVRWVKSANNSLQFDLNAVRLERAGLPIEGPGGVEQSFNFRAKQGAAAAMLVATLKNQISAYA